MWDWDDFVEKILAAWITIMIVGFVVAVVISIWIIAPEFVYLILGTGGLAISVASIWTIAEKISDEIAFRKIVKGWTLNDRVQDKMVASLTKHGVEIEKEEEKENNENPM